MADYFISQCVLFILLTLPAELDWSLPFVSRRSQYHAQLKICFHKLIYEKYVIPRSLCNMQCFSLQKSVGVKGVYESIHSLKIFDLLACPRLSVNAEEAKVTEQEQWREVREKYSNLSYFKFLLLSSTVFALC